jgi:hypothetical protein
MLLIAFLLSTNLFSQTPSVIWQKTLGGSHWDEAAETHRTADGGSITVGYSYSPLSGDKASANYSSSTDTTDIWVVKLDAAGNIQWQKTLLADRFEAAYTVKQAPDGGYIIGGTSDSGISGDKTEASYGEFDYWIIKLDATGTILWQKTIGGTKTDVLQDLQITTDGGFIAAGYSESGLNGNKTVASLGYNDIWVVKCDANGVEQWQKSLGTNANDIANEIRLTNDGGYIIGGYVHSNYSSIPGMTYHGANDFLVIKMDAAGTVQWQNTYGGSSDDYVESLQQTTDGGYILGGYSTSKISGVKSEDMIDTYGDYWIVKIDASGNIQWQNTIGSDNMDWLKSIAQTADGGYIMSGYSYSSIYADKTESSFGDADIWVVKTNSSGSVQWQKTLGGSSYDFPGSLEELDEGNGNYAYLLGGYSASDISGTKTENSRGETDYWVIKLGDPGPVNTPSVTDVSYCPNDAAQPLTAIGQNLLWYSTYTGGVGSSISPTPVTTTPGITTYYVSQTINNVESPRAILNVIIKTPPSVTITGLSSMCAGTSQTITAYAGTAFVWNDGVTTGTRVISPTTTTTYTVTITGHNGCTNVGSRTYTVKPLPTATISGVNAVCAGTSTTLTASGGGTYKWNTLHTTASIAVTPNATTTYTVTVTLNGCSATTSKTLTTNGVAPSSMTIVGLANQYYKNDAAITLVGTPTGGTFRVNNQIRTSFNPQNLSVGNHTVNYRISQGGCTSNIYRTVAVLNPPTTSNLQINNQSSFNGKVELNRIKLEWANNKGIDNDLFIVQKLAETGEYVDIQMIEANNNGNSVNAYNTFDSQPTEGGNTYRLKTVFKDGNTVYSETKTLNYNKLGNIQVFPNPTVDFIDINLESYIGKAVQMTIYNHLGQIVLNENIETVAKRTHHMELNNMPSGNYILRVTSPERRDAITKFVINQ